MRTSIFEQNLAILKTISVSDLSYCATILKKDNKIKNGRITVRDLGNNSFTLPAHDLPSAIRA